MSMTMNIGTKLNMLDYLSIVNEIANEFFNEDGDYQPHIGLINAMCVFYNNCVKSSKFDEKFGHEIVDPTEISEVFEDEEFIQAFNASITVTMVCFDFANAFRDAMDIVNTKKNSVNQIYNKIKKLANDATTVMASMVTKENLDRIDAITDKIKNGTLDVDAFIESYGSSEMFKRTLESAKKAEA